VTAGDGARTEPAEERLDAQQVKERASRGVVTLGVRGVATRLLALAGNIVLARLLLPSEFGALAFGFSVVTFAGVLSSGGLAAALMRRKETPTRWDLECMFGFQLLVMTAAAVLIAGLGIFFGRAGALAAVMAFSLPIDAIRVPSALMAERVLAFGIIARAEVAEIAAFNVAAIAAVACGFGVWGVAGATIVRAVVGSAMLVLPGNLGFLAPRLSRTFLRSTAKFGLSFQSVAFVNLIRDQGFNVIVAAGGGLTVLGFLTIAWRLGQALVLLFESMWRVAYPAMARLIEIEADAARPLQRGLRVATVVTGAIVAVLVGSCPSLVPALFGERWHDSIAILPGACLGTLVAGPLSACAIGYLSAVKRLGTVVWAAVLQTGVMFATVIPLLNAFDTFGLGISLFAGSIASGLVLGPAIHREAGVHVARAMAAPVAAACVAATAAYAVAVMIEPASVGLVASASVAVASYGALSWLLYRADLLYVIGLARGLVKPSRPAPEEVAA
jgi:O-antigen/teichoic acid export membrane protein